jgi:hypothetical protein
MPMAKPNAVIVINEPFVTELLKQMGISEKHVGDVTMNWPVAGFFTVTIHAMPEDEHLRAACRKALEVGAGSPNEE